MKEKQQVKLVVYNHFVLVGTFYKDYEGERVDNYIEYVKKQAYFPFDTIDVDDGRMILIPIKEHKYFAMVRDVSIKESISYNKFCIVESGCVADLERELILEKETDKFIDLELRKNYEHEADY